MKNNTLTIVLLIILVIVAVIIQINIADNDTPALPNSNQEVVI